MILLSYTTATNRIIQSTTPLDYALDASGYLHTEKLQRSHLTHALDTPTPDLATLLSCAQGELQNIGSSLPQNAKKDRLLRAAKEAANMASEAHAKCVSLQNNGYTPLGAPLRHIYSTDRGRYAVSQQPLSYAANATNPAIIREDQISENDLTTTCFVPSIALAKFVVNATTTAFHTSHTSPSTSIHSNEVIQINGDLWLRDRTEYMPYDSILNIQTANTVLQAYRAAFLYEGALCRTYIETAKKAS